MAKTPTKGRPLPSGGRVTAARDGRSIPVFPIAVVGIVLVLVLGFVAARTLGGDEAASTVETQPFAPVTVEGTALAELPEDGTDPSIGATAPTLIGETETGEAITIAPGEGPMVVAFVAHWCPHCQAEVPRLVEMMDDAGSVDGVEVVAVLTGSNSEADNYPPGEWLAEEGWTGRVMVDDLKQSALTAYGPSGYPYLVALDADGQVVARASGEQGDEGLRTFIAQVAP